jgi:putative oxidoreductase
MRNPLHNDSFGKLILRLTVGPLILLHGVHKMLHLEFLDSIGNMLASINLPAALAYGVFLEK